MIIPGSAIPNYEVSYPEWKSRLVMLHGAAAALLHHLFRALEKLGDNCSHSAGHSAFPDLDTTKKCLIRG